MLGKGPKDKILSELDLCQKHTKFFIVFQKRNCCNSNPHVRHHNVRYFQHLFRHFHEVLHLPKLHDEFDSSFVFFLQLSCVIFRMILIFGEDQQKIFPMQVQLLCSSSIKTQQS